MHKFQAENRRCHSYYEFIPLNYIYIFKICDMIITRFPVIGLIYKVEGNITINTTLKYLPENLIEYVIFHEMAHFIERKHNKHFWNIISKKFKNYKKLEKDLLIYWFLIQSKNNPDKLSNPHSRTTF